MSRLNQLHVDRTHIQIGKFYVDIFIELQIRVSRSTTFECFCERFLHTECLFFALVLNTIASCHCILQNLSIYSEFYV